MLKKKHQIPGVQCEIVNKDPELLIKVSDITRRSQKNITPASNAV